MVSALDRKIGREIRASGLSLFSIMLVIAVGVACVVALGSSLRNLQDARSGYYARCRVADFWVDLKKAPVRSAMERLEGVPGLMTAQTRITSIATVDIETEPAPVTGLVVSLPQRRDEPLINDIVLRSGSWFSDVRREEVILHDPFARAHGLAPGDTVRLVINNKLQELTVVGTATGAEFVYLIAPGSLVPDPRRYGVFYIKRRFAEDAFDFEDACNQIVGRMSPAAGVGVDLTLESIERRLDDYGVLSAIPRRDNASHRLLTDEIQGLAVSATVLPGVFLAAAALILNVMMSRIAEQQRTIIGTLKAIGYDNRRVLLHFTKLALAVAVVGAVVGSVGGYALAAALTDIYRDYYEFPLLESRVHPSLYLIGALAAFAAALLGVSRGVRAVIRLSPAAAMRPRPPQTARRTRLKTASPLWRRLGFRWQMALRSLFRSPVRTATGLFAAAMGAALLLLTFSSTIAFQQIIDFQFNKVLRSDYDMILESERDAGALLEARRLPGVDRAEPILEVPCDLRFGHREKKASVTGVAPNSFLTAPHDARGEPVPIPESGLLLTERLADQLGVRVGDTLRLRPIRGERLERDAPVARIVASYLGIAAYADKRWLDRLVGEADAVSAIQLSVNPDRRERLKFFAAARELPALENLAPRAAQRDQLQALLTTQMWSLGVLVAFAGVLFLGSVLTSSLISLSERRREIATLRALGFTVSDVGAIFLRESALVHMLGALAGLPLGALLMRALIHAWSNEFYRVPFVMTPAAFMLTLAASASFILAAHAFVARSIRAMNWREALNVKE